MEPASEFDLNRSLQIWREQLAAQPGLTPEARQELESHLGETMADLRQRGIIAEEAFWLARCRVGNIDFGHVDHSRDPGWSKRFANADPTEDLHGFTSSCLQGIPK